MNCGGDVLVQMKYNMVWIELREKDKQQWLWLNGEKIENCIIEDDRIVIAGERPGFDISIRQ